MSGPCKRFKFGEQLVLNAVADNYIVIRWLIAAHKLFFFIHSALVATRKDAHKRKRNFPWKWAESGACRVTINRDHSRVFKRGTAIGRRGPEFTKTFYAKDFRKSMFQPITMRNIALAKAADRTCVRQT